MSEYAYSTDGEIFYGDEDSRESAVAVVVNDWSLFPGEIFYTGRFVRKTIADVIPDARDLIEEMQIAVSDEIGECGENWLAGLTVDDIDDLQTTIRLAIIDWANRADINTEFCAMRDVKMHRVCENGSVELVEDIEND